MDGGRVGGESEVKCTALPLQPLNRIVGELDGQDRVEVERVGPRAVAREAVCPGSEATFKVRMQWEL